MVRTVNNELHREYAKSSPKKHIFRSDKYLISILRIPTQERTNADHLAAQATRKFYPSYHHMIICKLYYARRGEESVWFTNVAVVGAGVRHSFGIFHKHSNTVVIYMWFVRKAGVRHFRIFQQVPETRANIFLCTRASHFKLAFYRLARLNVVAEKYQSDFKIVE